MYVSCVLGQNAIHTTQQYVFGLDAVGSEHIFERDTNRNSCMGLGRERVAIKRFGFVKNILSDISVGLCVRVCVLEGSASDSCVAGLLEPSFWRGAGDGIQPGLFGLHI